MAFITIAARAGIYRVVPSDDTPMAGFNEEKFSFTHPSKTS